MTSKERINKILHGQFPDRIPFVPAIYEHKAALIGKRPSEVCRDSKLLYESLLAEHELYAPDILTVGIDVYNIEAEAIGCEIYYSDGLEVPIIKSNVLDVKNLDDLLIPDPEKDGRMPLILEAAKKVYEKVGKEVYVCVGVSGPFSLAASLMGFENLSISLIENPDYVKKILNYCFLVLKKYSESILKNGLEIIVFDSASAPPLVSPNQYKEFIFPVVRVIFDFFKVYDANILSYVVGGNTRSILESILVTGVNNILCDFNADLNEYIKKAGNKNISVRKNLDPLTIVHGTDEDLKKSVLDIIALGKNYPGFILGTGILPYETPLNKMKIIRNLIS